MSLRLSNNFLTSTFTFLPFASAAPSGEGSQSTPSSPNAQPSSSSSATSSARPRRGAAAAISTTVTGEFVLLAFSRAKTAALTLLPSTPLLASQIRLRRLLQRPLEPDLVDLAEAYTHRREQIVSRTPSRRRRGELASSQVDQVPRFRRRALSYQFHRRSRVSLYLSSPRRRFIF